VLQQLVRALTGVLQQLVRTLTGVLQQLVRALTGVLQQLVRALTGVLQQLVRVLAVFFINFVSKADRRNREFFLVRLDCHSLRAPRNRCACAGMKIPRFCLFSRGRFQRTSLLASPPLPLKTKPQKQHQEKQ